MKQSSDQLVEWLYTIGFSEQAATILRRVSNDWYILKNNNLNDQEDMLIIIKGEIIKKSWGTEIWTLTGYLMILRNYWFFNMW